MSKIKTMKKCINVFRSFIYNVGLVYSRIDFFQLKSTQTKPSIAESFFFSKIKSSQTKSLIEFSPRFDSICNLILFRFCISLLVILGMSCTLVVQFYLSYFTLYTFFLKNIFEKSSNDLLITAVHLLSIIVRRP